MMKSICNNYLSAWLLSFAIALFGFGRQAVAAETNQTDRMGTMENGDTISLPEPVREGNTSVEAALNTRRSVREFGDGPVTLSEMAQLLWAADGVVTRDGHRTAPSAGALYPMELYLVASKVTSLTSGIYKYVPRGHQLKKLADGDIRNQLYAAALEQSAIRQAAAILVITGVHERTRVKYGDRATRYVYMEAGHVAQNVYLQATSLKLGTVVMGAFDDDSIQRIMGMPKNEKPLYLMPVGKLD